MYGVFHYAVGDLVKLSHGGPVRTIIARAWVLLPAPGGGWGRAAVYRLDDADIGGYYEGWLLPAFEARPAYFESPWQWNSPAG